MLCVPSSSPAHTFDWATSLNVMEKVFELFFSTISNMLAFMILLKEFRVNWMNKNMKNWK